MVRLLIVVRSSRDGHIARRPQAGKRRRSACHGVHLFFSQIPLPTVLFVAEDMPQSRRNVEPMRALGARLLLML